MQPPAIVRPLRPTMLRALRSLTRLAMAALVLTLTFNGPTVASAEATPPSAYQLRPASATVLPQPATRPIVTQVASRPVDEQDGHGRASALPASDPRTIPTVTPLRPPAADPGQGFPGRRAPPRA
ncbi:hypothetical protein GA0074692_4601 [Micromonospora pallida]|uniref:Secreted protein n=1 Tax=Micromonospora pallida TaxID=145854 RepID=A0A1C6T638_9ACTN|nr:hypothetical protein [Micromonospora pallida]SCL37241.1 hypothetical protein GA0074692_4601 [Micromonospora pallida]